MAGALAYRLFVWLLPLALVVVGGLGVVSEAASSSPSDAASSFGVSGLVSSSVANAARSGARVYALLIGVPLLMIATRSVLRTLIVTHRLAWTDLRSRTRKPTWGASARLLVALVGYFVVAGISHRVEPLLGPTAVLLTILLMVPYAALWLAVSVELPRRDAPWQALVPGAALFAVGIEAAASRHRVLHRAAHGEPRGHVRLAGRRRGAAAQPVPDQPARGQRGDRQRHALGSANALGRPRPSVPTPAVARPSRNRSRPGLSRPGGASRTRRLAPKPGAMVRGRAPVAQGIEHQTSNLGVGGSNPPGRITRKPRNRPTTPKPHGYAGNPASAIPPYGDRCRVCTPRTYTGATPRPGAGTPSPARTPPTQTPSPATFERPAGAVEARRVEPHAQRSTGARRRPRTRRVAPCTFVQAGAQPRNAPAPMAADKARPPMRDGLNASSQTQPRPKGRVPAAIGRRKRGPEHRTKRAIVGYDTFAVAESFWQGPMRRG